MRSQELQEQWAPISDAEKVKYWEKSLALVKSSTRSPYRSCKILTEYENQAQVVTSPNQAQHESLEDITLYLKNPQNVNQEGPKSPKHKVHFRDLHQSFGPHRIPCFGDESEDD